MATTFLEPGTGATHDLSFFSSTTGSASSDSTVIGSGARSLRLFTSSPAAVALATRSGVLADAGRRISFYFKSTAWTGNVDIVRILTASATNVFSITRSTTTNAGALQVTPAGVTPVFGTTVLTANTVYRVCVSYYVTSTSVWRVKVYLNGTLEIDANSTGTLARSGSDTLTLVGGIGLGANQSAYFSDVYVDDGASSSGQTDTGNIYVTPKRPNANGTNNAFTTQIGSGGSSYGSGHSPQVNERALSTTNGWSVTGAGSVLTEEYNVEGLATGDVDLSSGYSVVDIGGWVYASAGSAQTGQMVLNGSTSNISLTTTNTLFRAYAGAASYPSGTGSDIGMKTSTGSVLFSLYECGVIVAVLVQNAITATDSLKVQASEAGVLDALLAAADSLRLTLTEVADLLISGETPITATDLVGLSVSELVDLLVSLDVSEPVAVQASEAAALLAVLDVAESAGVVSSEQAEVLVNAFAADTAGVLASEQAAVQVSVDASESGRVVVAEAVGALDVLVAASEALGLTLGETAALLVALDVADAPAVILSETGAVAVAGGAFVTVDVADTLRAVVAEAVALDAILAVAEQLAVGASESMAIEVLVAAADAAAAGASESAAVAALLAASDSASLQASEATALTLLLTASDAAALGMVEAAALLASLDVSEAAVVLASESASLVGSVTATDAVAPAVAEDGAVLVSLAAVAEALGVSVAEAAALVEEKLATEALTIVVSEAQAAIDATTPPAADPSSSAGKTGWSTSNVARPNSYRIVRRTGSKHWVM